MRAVGRKSFLVSLIKFRSFYEIATIFLKKAYDAASCTAEWGAFPRLGNDTNRLIALHIKHSMQYLLTVRINIKTFKYFIISVKTDKLSRNLNVIFVGQLLQRMERQQARVPRVFLQTCR